MDSMVPSDVKCPFCYKPHEARDYSMVRCKRANFNFREIFSRKGGILKRTEKEDTIELALPDAFSLDSEDSSRSGSVWEKEAAARYSKLGPTCVRFLGLHRIIQTTPQDPPQNFALVAIGTMSNPFPAVWSANGEFCEEHLQENLSTSNSASDKFRSVDDFRSSSCQFCLKNGIHPTVTGVHKSFSTNIQKMISRRAALRLLLLDEEPLQQTECCSYLEQNFFFRWTCAPFSEVSVQQKQKMAHSDMLCPPRCANQADAEVKPENWIESIRRRALLVCRSSPDLLRYANSEQSSVCNQAIDELIREYQKKSVSNPYLNPEFKDSISKCFLKVIARDSSSDPHWQAFVQLHADIIATDLAQFCVDRNHHFLRLDQLKAGSGFFECEVTSKKILLERSKAEIMVTRIPKLNATFTDESEKPVVPSVEIIGISDSWLYAAGDPYFRCSNCSCESNRSVVNIDQHPGILNNKSFIPDVEGIQVMAFFNGRNEYFDVTERHGNQVTLNRPIPDTVSSPFTLFFEYPFHKLAGKLRVKFDIDGNSNSKTPIMIMQSFQGGDYSMPEALPSPNLFSIIAIFSNKPNASSSSQNFWKFRIGRVLVHPVPAFHHFWGNTPMLVQPWKSVHYQPRANHYCVVPPQGNCILNNSLDSDIFDDTRSFEVGQCYYFYDPDCKSHCFLNSKTTKCNVCSIEEVPASTRWIKARCDLCNDFIPLVDCVTESGQSKWGLHFELDSMFSPSHQIQPQGGVLFAYIPANLGKSQKHRPEVLGFVGTSSPVLSMDIIERQISDKTSFASGFRETFESLLVSCLDGRICVVTSPQIPVFESSAAPSDDPQKAPDDLRSIERLKNHLKEQLQQSHLQHSLFNGCVVDYLLKVDSGSPSSFKSVICPSSPTPRCFFPLDSANNPYKLDCIVKYLEHSISKPSSGLKRFCQSISAANTKATLEQQIMRKLLVNLKIMCAVTKDEQTTRTRNSVFTSLSSQKIELESKISNVFFECLLEIYRLDQDKLAAGPASPPLSLLNFLTPTFQDSKNRDFCEMKKNLRHVRKSVVRSLGYQNSTVDLSRAELYFLQSVRDLFSFQHPSVAVQMSLELLTPVAGLKRLQAHAKSVHYLDSDEAGCFEFLALIQLNHEGFKSCIYHYKLKIPQFQRRSRQQSEKEAEAGTNFMSAWLPHHSSVVKVKKTMDGTIFTDFPHGLHFGDFVRFLDSGIHEQNLLWYRVKEVREKSFQLDCQTSGISLREGSFVQMKPRFFPFQRLEQESYRLSDICNSVKFLIFRKVPTGASPRSRRNFCQAAWIETCGSRLSIDRKINLCIWAANGSDDLVTRVEFMSASVRDKTTVECACFLPSQETEAMIALGCSFIPGNHEPVQSQLYIYSSDRNFYRADVQGTLPVFLSLNLLPADDAADNSRTDTVMKFDNCLVYLVCVCTFVMMFMQFILVAATKLTELNQNAFFLHVTKVDTTFKVKCFRSINEVRATISSSKNLIATTPLRANHSSFSSIDIIPIRSKAHNVEDSWLHFRDFRIITKSDWPVHRLRLLETLKAEHHFIQFRMLKPPPTEHHFSQNLDTANLRNKVFSIERVSDSSFSVVTIGPNGTSQKSQVPSVDYEFRVVVPSDIDGEYGHEHGIAKFVFLLDSPSALRRATAINQLREKSRLFAVPLRSWFPRLVQGKFGNNLQ